MAGIYVFKNNDYSKNIADARKKAIRYMKETNRETIHINRINVGMKGGSTDVGYIIWTEKGFKWYGKSVGYLDEKTGCLLAQYERYKKTNEFGLDWNLK